ncbi:hypothetical protein [Mycobacterium gastri]|nr:hypothetical protein [Mycobacterium gastri]
MTADAVSTSDSPERLPTLDTGLSEGAVSGVPKPENRAKVCAGGQAAHEDIVDQPHSWSGHHEFSSETGTSGAAYLETGVTHVTTAA